MNCRRVERLLTRHLDGLLSPREAQESAQHLAACPACRQRREDFQTNREGLRALHDLPFPAGGAPCALARWEAERVYHSARPWFFTRPALASLAMMAVFVALAGWALLRREAGIRSQTADGPTVGVRRLAAARNRLTGEGAIPTSGKKRSTGGAGVPARERQPTGIGSETIYRAMAAGRLTESGDRSPHSKMPALPPPQDDLAYLNADAAAVMMRWGCLRADEAARLQAQWDRLIRVGDDFVAVPFPRVAALNGRSLAAAFAAYKQEKAVVDPRLVRKVGAAVKGIAFADLCKQWSDQTGIELMAGRSVADDKATIFCKERSLRDLMRQITQVFGFVWRRSGEPGAWRYELFQDLRSQLMEEELRNRDRNEALLALDREMQRYGKFFDLSPEEAKERAKSASPEEKAMLEKLAGFGWGPTRLYQGLSPDQLAALRNGQELRFNSGSGSGAGALSSDMAHGILRSLGDWRIANRPNGGLAAGPADQVRDGQPPAEMPGAQAMASLRLDRSDLGRFSLVGGSGFQYSVSRGMGDKSSVVSLMDDPIASGVSPSVQNPQNAKANAKHARDPALTPRVTIEPKASCRLEPGPNARNAGPRMTSADVLEAIHRATGMDVVADYYTRLYTPEETTVRSAPVFDALNRLSDTMRVRWGWTEGWLHFRSASFFNDRLKEVPNHLLARWADLRRKQGALRLDDLLDIAQLADAPLDSRAMAEGARALYGLKEWGLAASANLRPHWRFLAGFSAAQRQQAASEKGLAFSQMPFAQQQRYIALTIEPRQGAQSVTDLLQPGTGDLAGATLRVDYRSEDAKPTGPERASAVDTPDVKITYVYGMSKKEITRDGVSVNVQRNRVGPSDREPR